MIKLTNSSVDKAGLYSQVIPNLSLQGAKTLNNVDAERAVSRAYQIELSRTKAIGEAMFKSGKALRFTLSSSGRQLILRTQAARRQFEPGFRNKK